MSDHTERADVEVRLPAEGAFASVLRTTAASVAARLDFTIDEIEDLRIAIGEATTLVLAEADPGADLVCRFRFLHGALRIEVDTEAADEPVVDAESFAWQVLDTMADQVEAASTGGRFTVGFTLTSEVAAQAGAER